MPAGRSRAHRQRRRLRSTFYEEATLSSAEAQRRERFERQCRAAEVQNARLHMQDFDRLPLVVRRAMAASVVTQPAHVAYNALLRFEMLGGSRHQAAELLAQVLAERDEIDVQAFSRQQLQLTGRPSHHVAAGATICRPTSRTAGKRRLRLN